MTELFAIASWAASYLAAHIAFASQRVKLAPVMRTFRQGLIPLSLVAMGFAPFTQAHGMPAPVPGGGSNTEAHFIDATRRDGMSLDQAVRMAESQFNARVVRTDVQDEDGRKVYVLKLLSEGGRVITVRIDAATGRMR
jgi:peptidase YpeB-like protein